MVFIDSGPFLGRYLAADPFKHDALQTWSRLKRARLFTSNHVLDETFTLLARRAGCHFAAERAERFYASSAFEIVYSTHDDELQAARFFRQFAGQSVSFTDCTSFAIMRRLEIRTAFTFDRRFLHAGFRVIGLA